MASDYHRTKWGTRFKGNLTNAGARLCARAASGVEEGGFQGHVHAKSCRAILILSTSREGGHNLLYRLLLLLLIEELSVFLWMGIQHRTTLKTQKLLKRFTITSLLRPQQLAVKMAGVDMPRQGTPRCQGCT